eukprot:UN32133
MATEKPPRSPRTFDPDADYYGNQVEGDCVTVVVPKDSIAQGEALIKKGRKFLKGGKIDFAIGLFDEGIKQFEGIKDQLNEKIIEIFIPQLKKIRDDLIRKQEERKRFNFLDINKDQYRSYVFGSYKTIGITWRFDEKDGCP